MAYIISTPHTDNLKTTKMAYIISTPHTDNLKTTQGIELRIGCGVHVPWAGEKASMLSNSRL